MLTPKDVHTLLAAADSDAGLFVPRAALATLVRTQGSSFRRAGSQMLVGANGRIVRGFSGGCPESDIALRARSVIDYGTCERVRYDREHGLDVLIEMGCGGELEIVIEPLADRSCLHFLDIVAELWRSRSPAMMASVFPADLVGAPIRRLIWREGEILLDEINDQDQAAAIVAGAVTGGSDENLLYQTISPPTQLLLIGANAVADGIVRAALELAWPVVCVDTKTTSPERFMQQYAASCDSNTFVVCMTYQIERDLDYAAAALATAVPYVGVLGSHRRARQMRQRLQERCGAIADDRLYTPAGLSIGSEDAEAIAISLIAEIMAVAARKSGLPLSRSYEPIHARSSMDAGAESPP